MKTKSNRIHLKQYQTDKLTTDPNPKCDCSCPNYKFNFLTSLPQRKNSIFPYHSFNYWGHTLLHIFWLKYETRICYFMPVQMCYLLHAKYFHTFAIFSMWVCMWCLEIIIRSKDYGSNVFSYKLEFELRSRPSYPTLITLKDKIYFVTYYFIPYKC